MKNQRRLLQQSCERSKTLSRTIPKNMAMNVETISPQQNAVRRSLKIILPKLEKDLYDIELHLVPILTYKTDENMAARLKHISIKHSQISRNIKTHEIEGVNNIDHPISPDSKLTLMKLIIDLKTEESEKFAIAITHSWNGALELWVKKKHKKCKRSRQSFASLAMHCSW